MIMPYNKMLSSKEFARKSPKIRKLYVEMLKMLEAFGYPIDTTPRRLQKTIGAYLALANVKSVDDISKPSSLDSGRALTTREIIDWENDNLKEDISSGSYDDIRRKDLKLLVLGDIVLKSNPNTATNDSTRGYGLNPFFSSLMELYGKGDWVTEISKIVNNGLTLKERLSRKRIVETVPVCLPSGVKLKFSNGEHNILQKRVIEEFLPRYGFDADLLYVGDTADKYLFVNKELLENLGLPQIAHEDLPDILAYSKQRKWIYLIEAVHSFGPISETRLLHLKNITQKAKCDIVYVTAFNDVKTFKKFATEIAWETEVWIAENPDHMIHFNGGKFLGPYTK
jgi:type II restriction enzyme